MKKTDSTQKIQTLDEQLEELMDKYLTLSDQQQKGDADNTAGEIVKLYSDSIGINQDVWNITAEELTKILSTEDVLSEGKLHNEAAKIAKSFLAQSTGSRLIQNLSDDFIESKVSSLILNVKNSGITTPTLKDLFRHQIKQDLEQINNRREERQSIIGSIVGWGVGFTAAGLFVPMLAAICAGFIASTIGLVTGKQIGFGIGSVISKIFSPKPSKIMLKILEARKESIVSLATDNSKKINPVKSRAIFYKIVTFVTNEKTATDLQKASRNIGDHMRDLGQRAGEVTKPISNVKAVLTRNFSTALKAAKAVIDNLIKPTKRTQSVALR
jgi:hypothetical protein